MQELNDEAFYFALGKNGVVFCGLDTGNDFMYISKDYGMTWEAKSLIFNSTAIRPAYYDIESNLVFMNDYIFSSLY